MSLASFKNRLRNSWQRQTPFQLGALTGSVTSLLLALFAMFCFREPRVDIVFVNSLLQKGERVNPSSLGIRRIPQSSAFPDLVKRSELEHALNHVIMNHLPEGSPLRWQDIEDEGESERRRLSKAIPEHYRAASFSIAFGPGLKAHLREGDRIDLLGYFRTLGEGSPHTVKTVLQAIPLLSVHPEPVFLLTPEQAELLYFAQQRGDLFALLRNPHDAEENLKIDETELRKLLSTAGPSRSLSRAPFSLGKGLPQIMSLEP